jgi:hypothetical protein
VAGWAELSEELDRWHDAGATASFWWRDDDAADDTTQLDVLLKHAGAIPLALAVIPGLATRTLAERLAKHASAVVLQHGWRHKNHASGGNNEYPASRSMEEVSHELADGRRVLTALFGPQAIPVFVPPYHGFDDCFLPLLRRNGLAGISRKGPRPGLFAAEGILQVNAHMSPIKWGAPPSFADDDLYLSQIIDHLRGRRLGRYDATEATGLLTHHLAQNDRSYAFISRFVAVVSGHPACVWMNATTLFLMHVAANDVTTGTSRN